MDRCVSWWILTRYNTDLCWEKRLLAPCFMPRKETVDAVFIQIRRADNLKLKTESYSNVYWSWKSFWLKGCPRILDKWVAKLLFQSKGNCQILFLWHLIIIKGSSLSPLLFVIVINVLREYGVTDRVVVYRRSYSMMGIFGWSYATGTKIEEVIRRKGSKDECRRDERNLVIVW